MTTENTNLPVFVLTQLPSGLAVTDRFGTSWEKAGDGPEALWTSLDREERPDSVALDFLFGPIFLSPPEQPKPLTLNETIASVGALQDLPGGSAVLADGSVWLKTSEIDDTWQNAWGIRANSPAVFNDNPVLLFVTGSDAGSKP